MLSRQLGVDVREDAKRTPVYSCIADQSDGGKILTNFKSEVKPSSSFFAGRTDTISQLKFAGIEPSHETQTYKSGLGVILDSKIGSIIPGPLFNQLQHVRVVADKLYELRCKCAVLPSKVVAMDAAYLDSQDATIKSVLLFQYYATSYVLEHPTFRRSLFHVYYALKKISGSWLVPRILKNACRACEDEVEAIVNTSSKQQCLDIKLSISLTERSDQVTTSVSDILLRCPSPPTDNLVSFDEDDSSIGFNRQWQDSM